MAINLEIDQVSCAGGNPPKCSSTCVRQMLAGRLDWPTGPPPKRPASQPVDGGTISPALWSTVSDGQLPSKSI